MITLLRSLQSTFKNSVFWLQFDFHCFVHTYDRLEFIFRLELIAMIDYLIVTIFRTTRNFRKLKFSLFFVFVEYWWHHIMHDSADKNQQTDDQCSTCLITIVLFVKNTHITTILSIRLKSCVCLLISIFLWMSFDIRKTQWFVRMCRRIRTIVISELSNFVCRHDDKFNKFTFNCVSRSCLLSLDIINSIFIRDDEMLLSLSSSESSNDREIINYVMSFIEWFDSNDQT